MGLFTIVFAILLTLKLLGLITYSWWIVFSPLIIGFVISILLVVVAMNTNKSSSTRFLRKR